MRSRLPLALAGLAFCCALAVSARSAEPAPGPGIPIATVARTTPVDFESEILPIFRDNCLACHNRTRAKAELVLETPADVLKGSENGPVVVPGDGAKSTLLQVAAHQAKPLMPPKDNKVSAADLSGAQLGLLRLWIEQGAKGEVRAARPIDWQAPASGLQPAYAVALSPDGRFAAAGRANHVDLYDLPTRRLVATLRDPQIGGSGAYGPDGAAHRDMVESLAFSPDGAVLASGSFGEVKLWHRPAPTTRFALATPAATLVVPSPDGRLLALATEGAPLRLIDATSGKELRLIATSTSPARAVAFSPHGKLLAVASGDRGLRISATADGSLVAQTVLACDTAAIAWIGDGGNQLATGGDDGIVRIYTIPSVSAPWPAPRELKGHAAAVTALATLPGGAQLLSASADGSIRHWTLSDGQSTRQLSGGSPVARLGIGVDGKHFASVGASGPPRVWDAAKGSFVELRGDARANRALVASERAQRLAAANVAYYKATVQRAEAEQKSAGERVKVATDAKSIADKLAAEKESARARAAATTQSASGALAAAQSDLRHKTAAAEAAEASLKEAQEAIADAKADLDRSADDIRALEEGVGEKSQSLAEAKALVAKLAADAKLKQAVDEAGKALERADGELKAALLVRTNARTEWDLAALASTRAAEGMRSAQSSLASAGAKLEEADAALSAAKRSASTPAERRVSAIAFSPDGLTLTTAGEDGSVSLWSADGAALIDTLAAADVAPITSLAFVGPDALLIASPNQTSVVSLAGPWSLHRTLGSGDPASPLMDRVGALAFSPDGRLLATGSGEPSRTGQIKLWDVATGRLERDFADPHSDAVLGLEFSPDGRWLASGSADRFARVLDLSSGKVARTFEGHADHVLGVSWKADGRVLATCGADGQVKLWDVSIGERRANAPAVGKAVSAVHFLGVTEQLVAVSADGQVRILNDAGGVVRGVGGVAGDFFQAAAVTPDGHTLAVAGQSGQLTIWREPPANPPAPALVFPVPTTRPTAAAGMRD
jgi:WD40 repeat protein